MKKEPIFAMLSVLVLTLIFFYCKLFLNFTPIISLKYFLIFLGTLFIVTVQKGKFAEHISFKKFSLQSIPFLLCYALALQGLGSMLLNLLSTFMPLEDSILKMYMGFNNDTTGVMIIAIGLLAPWAEEVFFRGVIFKKLSKHIPWKTALLFQALFYSLVHMNMAQIPSSFIIGLAVGHLYHKTKNLWYSIILHMFFNFVALSMLQTSESYQIFILASAGLGVFIAATQFIKRKTCPERLQSFE